MTDTHNLTLVAGERRGSCDCEQAFTGTITKITKAWEAHVAEQAALSVVVDAVHRERAARLESEQSIAQLLDAGVSSHKIAEAIGYDGEALIMSSSTIQRIGRTHREAAKGDTKNVNTPRRRRRS